MVRNREKKKWTSLILCCLMKVLMQVGNLVSSGFLNLILVAIFTFFGSDNGVVGLN